MRAGADGVFEKMAVSRDIRQIYPRVKVQLVRSEPFFGPGMATLLKQIQALGSVREACEKTGMSYSKGWSLIRTRSVSWDVRSWNAVRAGSAEGRPG